MKLGISFLVAVSLALSPFVLAGTYTAFAGQLSYPTYDNLKLEQRSRSKLNAENVATGTRFVQFHPERWTKINSIAYLK
jgi:hypothetical protein